MGQLCGDALGSQVEFQSAETILKSYPKGVRAIKSGGTWNTLAGQPTDDSEMALLLARLLVDQGAYDPALALERYKYWLSSEPFDCGGTIMSSLNGVPMPDSQANGAMMRVSPLGIFAANYQEEDQIRWARQDAKLTHPNILTQEANALYVTAISLAIKNDIAPKALYDTILEKGNTWKMSTPLLERIELSKTENVHNFTQNSGWVLIAFQNALYQLLHAPNLEEGLISTVSSGGDTDTNGAICGALLGAVYGEEEIPKEWREAVLSCRPEKGKPGVYRPRPKVFWPTDATTLADKLIEIQY
jgi:ADP-ribosylglycohydrolase